MLKQHKNRLLEIIEAEEIDPSYFMLFEEGESLIIMLQNSPIIFGLKQLPDDFDTFEINYTNQRGEHVLKARETLIVR